jgi:hypothetical protein
MGTNDYARLKEAANSDGSNRTGPTVSANVMCLTCHRAHASGWNFMARWDMKSKYLVIDGRYPGIDSGIKEINTGRTIEEMQKSYFGRAPSKFGESQNSLCNKCHTKD